MTQGGPSETESELVHVQMALQIMTKGEGAHIPAANSSSNNKAEHPQTHTDTQTVTQAESSSLSGCNGACYWPPQN